MRMKGIEARVEVPVEGNHITIAFGRLELEDSDQLLKPVQFGFPPVAANPVNEPAVANAPQSPPKTPPETRPDGNNAPD